MEQKMTTSFFSALQRPIKLTVGTASKSAAAAESEQGESTRCKIIQDLVYVLLGR